MMDDLEREADRLFDAARRERPGEAARERTLAAFAAVRGGRRDRVRRWLGLVSLAACFGAGVWLLRRPVSDSSSGIGPERHAFETATPRASVASPRPVGSSDELRSPPASRPPAVPRRLAPAPSGSVGIERELALLDDARIALTSGDAGQALALLDRHQALRGRSLNAEATLLRIQALAGTGRGDAAAALARSFIASNPNSLLADRARRFIHSPPEPEGSGTPPAVETP
jgi:hypothetical protein